MIPSLWKPRARKLKQKREKKKRKHWIQTPYWYFCRKCIFALYDFFCFCFGHSASKSIWLSNSILLFFMSNQMLCFYLNYARRNLCNISWNVCLNFFFSFGIHSLSGKGSWVFCMLIVELLLPFPILLHLFFLITFLSFLVSTKILALLLSWAATFEVLLTSLHWFLNPRVTSLG